MSYFTTCLRAKDVQGMLLAQAVRKELLIIFSRVLERGPRLSLDGPFIVARRSLNRIGHTDSTGERIMYDSE